MTNDYNIYENFLEHSQNATTKRYRFCTHSSFNKLILSQVIGCQINKLSHRILISSELTLNKI